MGNENDWIVIDDALADAQSVASVSASDFGTDISMGISASMHSNYLNMTDCQSPTSQMIQVQLVRPLVHHFLAELSRLKHQNARLRKILREHPRKSRHEFITLLEYIIEWLLSLIEFMKTSSSSCSYPHFDITSYRLQTSSFISFTSMFEPKIHPDLGNLATMRLKAGSLVGTLFRPDIHIHETLYKARARQVWIRAF